MILHKYGALIREEFTSKLDEKLQELSQFPESSPKIIGFPNFYRSVLTKQTTLFYTFDINSQTITVTSLYDTRQNPDNLIKDID
ncbi:hypothetical protein SCB49_06092 [unidentified eubacterium SCB49]|nr:hypothetical protein SCB49_06092 [unidentified eubacterium SCB49]